MPWRKLGQLYSPRPLHDKLRSHAANPVPLRLNGDVYRVLFNGRDERNRSSVGWVDIDLNTHDVVAACEAPLCEPGPPGSFFADGISIGNVYEVEGRHYLPFMGWRNPSGQHWWGELGRFRVDPGGVLTLDPGTVWFGRSEVDPVSLSYPWVMALPEGGYRMWYGSTLTWDAGNGEMVHVLRAAASRDGHVFTPEGETVPWAIGEAQAFSRPTVATLPRGEHRMWFSVRSGAGETYRIGSARSADLRHWERIAGDIDVSATGWDAEMIAYPSVFRHDGRLLMLYNGNGYGATGFGLAEWVDAP